MVSHALPPPPPTTTTTTTTTEEEEEGGPSAASESRRRAWRGGNRGGNEGENRRGKEVLEGRGRTHGCAAMEGSAEEDHKEKLLWNVKREVGGHSCLFFFLILFFFNIILLFHVSVDLGNHGRVATNV